MNNFRVTAQLWFLTLLLVLTEQAAHNHNRKVMVTSALEWPHHHITHVITQEKGGERESDGAFSPRDHHHGAGEEHNNAFDHEAILGSRKEAEEFDELEPEEAKRRLGILLTKMDRDNDEAIDRLVIQIADV